MNFNMSISKLYLPIFAVCALFSCKNNETKTENTTKQPNIIYIMSDDHTTQAFGVYGSRLASLNPTPTLDKIANEGIIFNNCFVTNSICTPSRATIITGQYSQTNGVIDLEGDVETRNQYFSNFYLKFIFF